MKAAGFKMEKETYTTPHWTVECIAKRECGQEFSKIQRKIVIYMDICHYTSWDKKNV